MASRLGAFARQNWMLVSVFAAALVVAGWFAFQFIAAFLYLNDPRHKDGDLFAWMNPHFVMEMYDLPRAVVLETLELPPDTTGGRHLGPIAEELGLSMEELTARVRAAAAEYRSREQ